MQSTINSTSVKEFFKSIQGEGPYMGVEQVFIRFCKCNLNCAYCDTDFYKDENCKNYTPSELFDEIKKLNINNIHSISLTGGEPLMDSDFLLDFLPLTGKKIYLETNGTLPDKLKEVIDIIDIVSMDVKLDSASKTKDLFDKHKDFIEVCVQNKKEIFLKLVVDENITDDEIEKSIELAKPHNLTIILQPLMIETGMKSDISKTLNIFEKFATKYSNVRLIPQVHKFLNVE